MPSSPPPLTPPPKPTRPIAEPLKVGEDFDIYKIVECSPDSLRCKTSAGCLLLMAAGSAVGAVVLILIWWFVTRAINTTVYSSYGDKPLVWGFVLALLAVGSVLNLGRSLEISRPLKRVKVTKFFFSTKDYATDGLKMVRIEIIAPGTPPPVTPPNQGNAAPPPMPKSANQAILSLVGEDENHQPLVLKLGDSNLHASSAWPVLAATALHLARILKLPLNVDGAIDKASDPVREQIQQLLQIR